MKKFVTSSLFIFWAITVAVLVAGLIYYNKPNNITGYGANNSVSTVSSSVTKKDLVLTMAELNKHNSSQSCWLLISGKIYDVTSYLNQHPGGEKEIIRTCGTDATLAYDTRGNTGSHSSSARSMLDEYFIGNLDQTIKY